jgi:hypothetical protein
VAGIIGTLGSAGVRASPSRSNAPAPIGTRPVVRVPVAALQPTRRAANRATRARIATARPE